MSYKPNVLIVDDDKAVVESLSALFRDHDFSPVGAFNATQALGYAKDDYFDLIILDIGLPDIDGIEFLKTLKSTGVAAPVIIVTGQATIQRAIEATRLGAFNIIEKPPDPEKLILDSLIAVKQRTLELEVTRLRTTLLSQNDFVGESQTLKILREKLTRIAGSDSRVYIWGEPGAGKEMAARFLHFSSHRATGPFVAVNCAAIPGELFESELFGHEKGAFTGAIAASKGKFEMANNGTLFLDEVAELRPEHQAKLLRAVESSTILHLGSSKEIKIDVHIISASNKDLKKETQEGRFREDLYFRLNVIPVHVPPLREHKEDIPLLTRHFLDSLGYNRLTLDASAISILSSYDWPGNIRELKNIIERTAALCYRDIITASDIKNSLSGTIGSSEPDRSIPPTAKMSLREHTRRFEKTLLEQILSENGENITKVARTLKMDRGNLSKKLKKYGLTGKD